MASSSFALGHLRSISEDAEMLEADVTPALPDSPAAAAWGGDIVPREKSAYLLPGANATDRAAKPGRGSKPPRSRRPRSKRDLPSPPNCDNGQFQETSDDVTRGYKAHQSYGQYPADHHAVYNSARTCELYSGEYDAKAMEAQHLEQGCLPAVQSGRNAAEGSTQASCFEPQEFSLPLSALLDLLSADDNAPGLTPKGPKPAPASLEHRASASDDLCVGVESPALCQRLTALRSYSGLPFSVSEMLANLEGTHADLGDWEGGAGGSAPVSLNMELDLSVSLAALLSILSVDSEVDLSSQTPPAQAWPEEAGHAMVEEVPEDQIPACTQLTRQSSLDSRLRCTKAFPRSSSTPAASLGSSPWSSPLHSKMSPANHTPSPVLHRRLTGHRDTVLEDCWMAGRLVDAVEGEAHGLRAVSDIIESHGTASFYRGFSARSPLHAVKRSKRN